MASNTPPPRRMAPPGPPSPHTRQGQRPPYLARSARPTLVQRAVAVARRVFIVVAGVYVVLAVLGLVTALFINRQVVPLTWPLVALLLFLVGYGIFAWFAEPLYWANERKRQERQLRDRDGR